MSGETGECKKCMSTIPLKAERCPECGHEPSSHGIVGGLLLGLLAGAAVLLIGLILIIWVVAIGTSFGVGGALTLTAFFGLFLVPIAWIVWRSANAERETAAGYIRDWDEFT